MDFNWQRGGYTYIHVYIQTEIHTDIHICMYLYWIGCFKYFMYGEGLDLPFGASLCLGSRVAPLGLGLRAL